MFQEMLSQICSRGSVVRAVRFVSERLLVLIQTARFCPSGTSAPTLFKSSEAKPLSFQSPLWSASERLILLSYSVQKVER